MIYIMTLSKTRFGLNVNIALDNKGGDIPAFRTATTACRGTLTVP